VISAKRGSTKPTTGLSRIHGRASNAFLIPHALSGNPGGRTDRPRKVLPPLPKSDFRSHRPARVRCELLLVLRGHCGNLSANPPQVAEIFWLLRFREFFGNFRTPIENHPSVAYHFAVKIVLERAHSLKHRGADGAE
jgi:hypothetical protein